MTGAPDVLRLQVHLVLLRRLNPEPLDAWTRDRGHWDGTFDVTRRASTDTVFAAPHIIGAHPEQAQEATHPIVPCHSLFTSSVGLKHVLTLWTPPSYFKESLMRQRPHSTSRCPRLFRFMMALTLLSPGTCAQLSVQVRQSPAVVEYLIAYDT